MRQAGKGGSLMQIWKAGAKIPFIVQHPFSRHRVVVTRYNWLEEFFEGHLLDQSVQLSANWFEWYFVREA